MLFKSDTTVGMLADELNRWLKMKWSHADFNRELPTANGLFAYCKKLTDELGRTYESELAKEDLRLCLEAGRPELHRRHISFHVLTLMDLRLVREPQPSLELFAWMRGEEAAVIHFDLHVKHLEQDGDTCNAVKSVSAEPGQAERPILDILREEVSAQFQIQPDAAARWLSAPSSFREAHVMCPVCGNSELHISYPADDFRQTCGFITCDACDWSSYRERFHYRSELAEERVFKRELKYLRQMTEFQLALQSAATAFESAVDTLQQEMKKGPEKAPYKYAAAQTVGEWAGRLTELQKAWKAAQ